MDERGKPDATKAARVGLIERDLAIVTRYQVARITKKALCEEFGVSERTVTRAFKRHGLRMQCGTFSLPSSEEFQRRSRLGSISRWGAFDRPQKYIQDYMSGMKVRDIAKKYAVTTQAVYYAISKYKIE